MEWTLSANAMLTLGDDENDPLMLRWTNDKHGKNGSGLYSSHYREGTGIRNSQGVSRMDLEEKPNIVRVTVKMGEEKYMTCNVRVQNKVAACDLLDEARHYVFARKRNAKLARMEKAMPGYRKCIRAVEQYWADADASDRAFDRMMGDQSNDGACPQGIVPTTGEYLDSLRIQHPEAMRYIEIARKVSSLCLSCTSDMISFSISLKKEMEALEAGGKLCASSQEIMREKRYSEV
jgi:hypothetical protein